MPSQRRAEINRITETPVTQGFHFLFHFCGVPRRICQTGFVPKNTNANDCVLLPPSGNRNYRIVASSIEKIAIVWNPPNRNSLGLSQQPNSCLQRRFDHRLDRHSAISPVPRNCDFQLFEIAPIEPAPRQIPRQSCRLTKQEKPKNVPKNWKRA
jgi:hypothetical protein